MLKYSLLLFGFLALSFSASANVSIISLPDFDGSVSSGPFPSDLGIIGTFTYSLPVGSTITSATIGGDYGTVIFPNSTAGFDMVINGQTYVGCVPNAACWTGFGFQTPFSVPIPAFQFSFLAGGSVPLDVVQTNEFVVRYGSPTLTITYTTTPEPGYFGAMLTGMLGLTGAMRARKTRARG